MELFQLEGICFHSAGVFHLGKSAARMLGGWGRGGRGGEGEVVTAIILLLTLTHNLLTTI